MHRIPVGVLGASGYAGRELCALIARHPRLQLAFATANERRGEQARLGGVDVRFVAHDDAPLADAELVFSALPHGASATWVARVRERWSEGGRPLVRPAARQRDRQMSRTDSPSSHGSSCRDASVVANPGCYPTAILMALVPLAKRGLIVPGEHRERDRRERRDRGGADCPHRSVVR